MIMRIAQTAFVMLAVLTMGAASAFFDPPYITPEQPTPGQELTVNIRGGNCDDLVSIPGFPRISQVGNDIRIVYFSFHSDDIEFCNFDVGTAYLPVAGQPAGSYTYTIARVYLSPTNQEVEEVLGVVPVTVVGAPVDAQPIPAFGGVGLAIFVLILIMAAWRHRVPCRA